MSKLAVEIGQKIRFIRKHQGLTQEQLGEKVQQPQSYIGAIERGEKNISLETLERIAEALKVEVEELITERKLTEKNKLLISVQLLLKNRDHQEIKLLFKMIQDIINILDLKS